MKSETIIATTLGGVVAVAVGFAAVVSLATPPTNPPQSAAVETVVPVSPSDELDHVDELLTYLIEEEKLAHDVYVALADRWGTQVFSNISQSENQHQSLVANLMTDYGIEDPRLSASGEFTNDELQSLYDALLDRGMQSETAAIEVGVLIEQTDIRDLSAAMESISDPTIDAVLANLISASEKHLAAFSRQL